jgi:diguanylate cyclase (GGDEF)-like protein/PAS domain S-box-containing protein
MSMPVDPEMQARVAQVSGVDPATLPPSAERIASTAQAVASLGLDSPAVRRAPAAIWSTDAEGNLLTWNDMAARVLGWTAGEVIGQPAPFTLRAADPAAGNAPGHGVTEQIASRQDGHEVHLLVSSRRATAGDGPPTTVWFATDVTGERTAARALQHEHDRWRRLLPGIADTVAILDEHGIIREVTSDEQTVLGHPVQALTGSSWFALLDPAELERAWAIWERVLADPGTQDRDVFRARHADGHLEAVELTALNLLADPVVRGVVMTCRVVTAQKDGEALIAAQSAVLDLIAHGAPLHSTLEAVTQIVEEHTGGQAGVLLLSPDAREFDVGAAGSAPAPLLDLLRRARLTPSVAFETIDFRRPTVIGDLGADERTAELAPYTDLFGVRAAWTIPIIENRADELLGLIAVFHHEHRPPAAHERAVGDAAAQLAAIAVERERWKDRLSYQARHNELSGLPNRQSILERLDRALAATRPGGGARTVAVVFVDIDRFKAVNDSYGHAAGDRLLVRFAGRLRNLVGPDDFVGHFGADEFVIIIDRASGLSDARFVTHRIDLALAEPFSLEEGEVYLTASIGVALATGTESGVELIQQADTAMARAKERGRDRTEVFDQVMRRQADERLRIDRELRAAMAHAALTLHYQPTVDVISGGIIGAEALLRWDHPTEGLLPPSRFLAVADDTGTIVHIGRWVLDRAVEQGRRWIDRHPHLDPFTITVNVSPRQLASPGFVDHVDRVLERHAWPADQLGLDLDERVLVEDRDTSYRVLSELKDLGVALSIDDFGTGFSSLNELHRFPLDAVKIDPSFVASLRADGHGSPVATAVLHMAHALELIVVAEGVERADQDAGLRALRCERAQGIYYAAPAAPDDLEPAWQAKRLGRT